MIAVSPDGDNQGIIWDFQAPDSVFSDSKSIPQLGPCSALSYHGLNLTNTQDQSGSPHQAIIDSLHSLPFCNSSTTVDGCPQTVPHQAGFPSFNSVEVTQQDITLNHSLPQGGTIISLIASDTTLSPPSRTLPCNVRASTGTFSSSAVPKILPSKNDTLHQVKSPR
jgi:hypothetical protein